MFIEIIQKDDVVKRVLIKLRDIEAVTLEGQDALVHTNNGFPPIEISEHEYKRLKLILEGI